MRVQSIETQAMRASGAANPPKSPPIVDAEERQVNGQPQASTNEALESAACIQNPKRILKSKKVRYARSPAESGVPGAITIQTPYWRAFQQYNARKFSTGAGFSRWAASPTRTMP